jgi:hypothetical protein
MPGRSRPRQSPETAETQYARSAFRGGLDGASLVPAPVRDPGAQSGARGGSKRPLFRQDSFAASGATTSFPLTYRPLPYSERVFLDGRYCRQGTGGMWDRADGQTGAAVGFFTAPAAGSRVDVEYAYYEQAGGRCGPTYPGIVARGAAYMPVITGSNLSQTLYLPMAENFPGSGLTTAGGDDEYTAVDMRAHYLPGSYDALHNVVGPGPPLSTGSQYSRALSSTTGSAGAREVLLDVVTGAARQARFSEATVVGSSVLYTVEGRADMPSDNGQSFFFGRDGYWAKSNDERQQMSHFLYWQRSPGSSTGSWGVWTSVSYDRTDLPGQSEWTLPDGTFGDPMSPGVHSVSLQIDCPGKAMTVALDGRSFTVSSPALWWTPEMLAGESTAPDTARLRRWAYLEVHDAQKLTVDEFRIFDDMPLCEW